MPHNSCISGLNPLACSSVVVPNFAPSPRIINRRRLARRRGRLDGALGEQPRDLRENAEESPEEDLLGGHEVLDYGEVRTVAAVLLLGSASFHVAHFPNCIRLKKMP